MIWIVKMITVKALGFRVYMDGLNGVHSVF